MKVRVKFEKYGPARFLGHLDTMRYFQKAVRRAKIPIAFSSGFRPHMIMSFAAPLGLGLSSSGEYFDMELREGASKGMTSEILARRLDDVMAEGFRVLGVRQIPEGKKYNAMALTAAAGYEVRFLKESGLTARDVEDFCGQPSVLVEKETKGGTKTVDIRPGIYRLEVLREDPFTCSMLLAASSGDHVKPRMVLEALAAFKGVPLVPYSYGIHKLEVYADRGGDGLSRFVPLGELGEALG